MPDVVIVTGPPGAGKTSVCFECLEVLDERGVPAAMVDAELVYYHPKPAGDPLGYAVAEQALAALWPVYEQAGVERLLLARVVENEEQLAVVERAVPGARIELFRLVLGPEANAARLERREIGAGLEWHLSRAAEVARATLGTPVDGERPVRVIAEEILERAAWL